MVQNIWIPLRRTRLSRDVKTARSTPWITQATTAHPTVSPKERTSTSMSPSTSTPSIPPLSWAWKPWGEMVCPYPPSLLLLSQPQPQAPISRLPSRLACPTTPSPQPNHLHLVFLAIMVHRLTSSMPTTPSNLQGNLAIQVAALLLRVKQELLLRLRWASRAPCPLQPPSGMAACQPTRAMPPHTLPVCWSMEGKHQVKPAGRS